MEVRQTWSTAMLVLLQPQGLDVSNILSRLTSCLTSLVIFQKKEKNSKKRQKTLFSTSKKNENNSLKAARLFHLHLQLFPEVLR